MNWSRAKSILIILFLLINLFLLSTLVVTERSIERISPETVQNTLTLLSQNGIVIDESLIPQKNVPVMCYDVESVAASTEELLQLVHSGLQRAGYAESAVRAEVTDNGFVIEAQQAIRPYDEVDAQNLRPPVEKLLKTLGLPGRDFTVYPLPQADGIFAAEVRQRFKNQEFFGTSLVLRFTQDGFVSAHGNWLKQDILRSDIIADTNFPSVLIDFIQNPDRKRDAAVTITAVGQVSYVSAQDLSGEYGIIQSVPAYTLTTDEGKTYLYDARSNIASSAKYIGCY